MGARLGDCEVLLSALSRRVTPISLLAEIGWPMSGLRLVLGDQISIDLTVPPDLDPGRDTVLMMEMAEENQRHLRKIVGGIISAASASPPRPPASPGGRCSSRTG